MQVFDPFVKELKGASVNTSWHQDGTSLVAGDDYFGHYYLPDAEPDDGEGGVDAVVGATDWAEVCLPGTAEVLQPQLGGAAAVEVCEGDGSGGHAGGAEEEEEMIFDWSGLSDDTRTAQICPATFLTLPTATHRLIVLHDAECFHRVPLAALMRRPKRTIARVEFHGCDSHGARLLFSARASDARWAPLPAAAAPLPAPLASLCEEHAEASAGTTTRAEALRAYVAGELPMKTFLEERLRKKFELALGAGDL